MDASSFSDGFSSTSAPLESGGRPLTPQEQRAEARKGPREYLQALRNAQSIDPERRAEARKYAAINYKEPLKLTLKLLLGGPLVVAAGMFVLTGGADHLLANTGVFQPLVDIAGGFVDGALFVSSIPATLGGLVATTFGLYGVPDAVRCAGALHNFNKRIAGAEKGLVANRDERRSLEAPKAAPAAGVQRKPFLAAECEALADVSAPKATAAQARVQQNQAKPTVTSAHKPTPGGP